MRAKVLELEVFFEKFLAKSNQQRESDKAKLFFCKHFLSTKLAFDAPSSDNKSK